MPDDKKYQFEVDDYELGIILTALDNYAVKCHADRNMTYTSEVINKLIDQLDVLK